MIEYGKDYTAPNGEPWPVPVPFGKTVGLPAFPVEVFPSWLTEMVTAVAVDTEVDPAMPGTVALSMLSASVGGRVEVEIKPGYREQTNLFIATVAKPGERKTPVQAKLSPPIREAERELSASMAARIAEAETLREIAVEAAARAKAEAGKAEQGTVRDTKTADAVAATMAAEAIVVPSKPRLIVDDVTSEQLASLMAANGGRMALISDEGGIFDTLAGRYSSAPNIDVYLKGHVGSPMRVDRRGREEYIPKPVLTVALMVQPEILRKVGGNETFRGRGLLARFLFVMAPSRVGAREFDSAPIPPAVVARYAREMQDLVVTLADWADPAVVALTDPARKTWIEAARAIEKQLGDGGSLDHVADWANKLPGTIARLAGLLHMAYHGEQGCRMPLDQSTMADAVKLGSFFVSHYLAATEEMGADPKVNKARYLLGLLRRLDRRMITVRDLYNRVTKSQVPKVGDLVEVLDLLEDHHWVMRLPEPERTGPGRRPSPTYVLNPDLLSADSADSAETE